MTHFSAVKPSREKRVTRVSSGNYQKCKWKWLKWTQWMYHMENFTILKTKLDLFYFDFILCSVVIRMPVLEVFWVSAACFISTWLYLTLMWVNKSFSALCVAVVGGHFSSSDWVGVWLPPWGSCLEVKRWPWPSSFCSLRRPTAAWASWESLAWFSSGM